MAKFKAGTKANWVAARKMLKRHITAAQQHAKWLSRWSTNPYVFDEIESILYDAAKELTSRQGVQFIGDAHDENPRQKRRRMKRK